MKKIISDKRIKIVLISCVVVALLVVGGIYAARTIARNTSIGEDAAANFAFIDAQVETKNVEKCSVGFEYRDGAYVYIVKFATEKAEYNYTVKASNGIILNKKMTKLKKNNSDKKDSKKKKKKKRKKTETTEVTTTAYRRSNNYYKNKKERSEINYDEPDDLITVDEAKSIAKSASGEASVVFTVAQLGTENGIDVYYVYFTAENKEYKYVINASTGSIISSQKTEIREPKKDDDSSDDEVTQNSGDEKGIVEEE